MSTNYYFKLKDDVVDKMKEVNPAFDIFVSMIDLLHIGKRSGGWVPIFQQTEWYSSVEEIKAFYDKYKDVLDIVDEYETLLSWDDLKAELIDWQGSMRHAELWCRYKDSEGYEFMKRDFS